MSVENWDEFRTAFQVAKMGTVSGAAQALGVHHATVIRHIDALESRLGVKLFQRHARGYTPTEAGLDVLKVAQTTDDQLSQLVSRIKGRGEEVAGELVVTSLPGMGPLLAPVLAEFQREHPALSVRYLTGERVFRLEYGEAHVAIRAGRPPQEPDNVVQPFYSQDIGLYAHQRYFDTYGEPQGEGDALAKELRFISMDDSHSRAPFVIWINENVPASNVVFRTSDMGAMNDAINAGAGVGFMPTWMAHGRENIREILPARPEWGSQNWIVTHVDLHRTPKVQAFLTFLKARAKEWPGAQ
ncbi:LysR family transcriptional regulator [Celeribacter halophilus]|jgi:DNA-binding transcriptional LysR family regulator|uniref:LysR family transcriptional regulator n=2 Tax=Celeribacter halophilus TaxID=576117 RepID=A0AAW7XQZ8_9RHOB|nr:LysR family transcriptional regulator [Celeribacter halophilus]MDO6456460.1 LysR family transcriptional regulator [Celeribacter halophilus]MDO6722923.1 LysR family transcriptional regulator [Celeribacter halophilus]